MQRGQVFVLLLVFVHTHAEPELDIKDTARAQTVVLSVNSERTISLAEGNSYQIGCRSGTWTSDRITSDPGNDNVTAAFVTMGGAKNLLNLQKFSAALSGSYNCTSSSGKAKRLTIQSGNPIVISASQQLHLDEGDTLGSQQRSQRFFASGDPYPTSDNITWLLNDTIAVKGLPGFQVLSNAILFLPAAVSYQLSGKFTVRVNTSAGVAEDSFNITVGVRPFITVHQSDDQAVLGSDMTLICTDSRGVPPPQFIWSKCTGSEIGSCQRLQSGDQNLIIMQTKSNTSLLKMTPVQIDHGGTYRCNASNVFGVDSQPRTIQVVLPPPQQVTVSTLPTTGPYIAGRNLHLICTAILPDAGLSYDNFTAHFTWKKGNQVINTTDNRYSTSDLLTSGGSRSQQLSIIPLSQSLDMGNYLCEVTISVTGNSITSPLLASTPMSINPEIPQMTVRVVPQHVIALDVAPYNDFNLSCSVMNLLNMSNSNISLEIIWLNGTKQLRHGQGGISITDTNSSESVIDLVANRASLYLITCRIKVVLRNEELFQAENSSGVTIRGPSVPTKPTNVRVALLKYNMAIIQFAIPTISYTPETYHIRYGTNPADLQHQSEVHTGNTDVSTVGEVLRITLNFLQHNTMYHYKIVSQNSEYNVTSDMQRFQTPALVLMQVRAGPFRGCRAGQVQQSSAVNDFFRTTIVEAINGRCFCDFPEANLVNGSAICPRDGSRDLVYRAYIVNLDHLTSSQLLRYVDDWVRSEPYVSSGVAVVGFNPNCSTSVNSMDEMVCAGPVLQGTTGFPLGTTGILIVTVVGAVILLLFIIVLILVCVIVLQQKQLRSHRKRRKRATYEVARQESFASGTGESSSGFAESKGIDWKKPISVTECTAYGIAYTKVDPDQTLHAVVYDKDPKDATPCIYDSIHDIPRAVPSAAISSTNPRMVVLSDDTDTTGNSDTGGSVV